jgi:hypothetical protein
MISNVQIQYVDDIPFKRVDFERILTIHTV